MLGTPIQVQTVGKLWTHCLGSWAWLFLSSLLGLSPHRFGPSGLSAHALVIPQESRCPAPCSLALPSLGPSWARPTHGPESYSGLNPPLHPWRRSVPGDGSSLVLPSCCSPGRDGSWPPGSALSCGASCGSLCSHAQELLPVTAPDRMWGLSPVPASQPWANLPWNIFLRLNLLWSHHLCHFITSFFAQLRLSSFFLNETFDAKI